jgi:hypothetical protein
VAQAGDSQAVILKSCEFCDSQSGLVDQSINMGCGAASGQSFRDCLHVLTGEDEDNGLSERRQAHRHVPGIPEM